MLRRVLLWVLVVASVLLVAAGVFLLSRIPVSTTVSVPTTTPTGELNFGDGVPRMSVQALSAQLQEANPPQVWEFRSPASYAEAHVPGSRLLALEEVEAAAQGLDRTQPIVTLCA